MDNNAELWVKSKNCKKIVAYKKMSTIFPKIVRKQCLHACDFFHVCFIPVEQMKKSQIMVYI